MSREYSKDIIPRAKELRKNMTPQENHIWYDFLRKYPVCFQRQKTIGIFIADFYCAKARLIIEIDGSQHYTEDGLEKDLNRTMILNELGISVIRFTNSEIDKNFDYVCRKINETVKSALLAIKDREKNKTKN